MTSGANRLLPASLSSNRVLGRRAGAGPRVPVLACLAMFLTCYMTWRPFPDFLFTYSDVLFVIVASGLMLAGRVSPQPFGALTMPWLAALGAMLGGLFVGSIASPDPLRWPIVASQYSFAWLLLPVLMTAYDRPRLIMLAKALAAGVVAMEAFGAMVYFLYAGSFWETRNLLGVSFLTGAHRLGAFTADANWNGCAAASALPIVYFLTLNRDIRPSTGLVATGILMLGVALTASFTAFSSAMLASLLFFLLAGRGLKISHIVLAMAVIAVAVGAEIKLPEPFKARVVNAFTSGDINEAGTFVGRAALIREAWGQAEDHLLIGSGADQYRVSSVQHAPVHNMYLLLWVEGGLVAAVGWIGMMAVLFAASLAPFSGDRPTPFRRDRLAGAMALSTLTVLLVFSTSSPHMYARFWGMPVLLAIAIGATPQRALARRRTSPGPTATAAT